MLPAQLKFDIAAPAGWTYAPGDTIIGNIMRHAPIVAPQATLELELGGRMKVKVTKTRSNGSTTSKYVYRSRNQIVRQSEVLYRGPLHLPEGSEEPLSWPFAIQIPTEPLPPSEDVTPKASFLPLDKDIPARHVLPGTFFSDHHGWGSTSSDSKVEYWLKATLKYTFGTYKCHEANWTVNIRHPVQATDKRHELKKCLARQRVQTQRLIPGMEDAELSFKQKTQKFFGSSKVPEFHYQLELSVPWVIQLDDPQPIPVIVQITPLADKISESIQDVSQQVQIDWIRMTLKSTTECLAPSNWTSSSYGDDYSDKVNLNLESAFRQLESPLTVSTGKGNEPVHIGNMFQLVLGSNGLSAGKRRITNGGRIYPDFTTYGIKHAHSVEWQISLTVAGETEKHTFGNMLKVLAPE